MKAVVLAAGKGDRLWPLTETRPKPLLPAAGTQLLIHTLESLSKAGIRETILVVNYMENMIREIIDRSGLEVRVVYVQQPKPLGTAHAVKACSGMLKGEDGFAVVYGDNFYDSKAVHRLIQIGQQKSADVLIGSARVEDTGQFGRLTFKGAVVTSIMEKSPKRGPGEVIAGFYVMNDSVLAAVKKTKRSRRGEYELTDSIQLLINAGGHVERMSMHEGEWASITYPWDLLEANRMALISMEERREGTIESGVHVTGKLVASPGSLVRSGTHIEGPVYLGPESTVGPNTYLRAHTSIDAHAHVGANCEIKNSILMKGAKVPHLSYVGDSILGEHVSLGAGTITANLRFDEKNVASRVKKTRTDSGRRKLGAILGDKVRTGINVSLLPGVKVGVGAWLGPGSTIDHDVASGSRIKN